MLEDAGIKISMDGKGCWLDNVFIERLCRYISRPALSEKRLSLTPNGNVRYPLKTPYRDGTTHVMLLRRIRPP